MAVAEVTNDRQSTRLDPGQKIGARLYSVFTR